MNNQITIADLADSPILGNSKEVMAYLESYTPKDYADGAVPQPCPGQCLQKQECF